MVGARGIEPLPLPCQGSGPTGIIGFFRWNWTVSERVVFHLCSPVAGSIVPKSTPLIMVPNIATLRAASRECLVNPRTAPTPAPSAGREIEPRHKKKAGAMRRPRRALELART